MARPGSCGTAKEKAVIGQITGGQLICKVLKFEGLSNICSLAPRLHSAHPRRDGGPGFPHLRHAP
jgi:hypothetical protein